MVTISFGALKLLYVDYVIIPYIKLSRFFSGIGVGMTRDCSTLMVAQYFKRRREFVEIFIVSGSGLGIAVMSSFIKGAIRYSIF